MDSDQKITLTLIIAVVLALLCVIIGCLYEQYFKYNKGYIKIEAYGTNATILINKLDI